MIEIEAAKRKGQIFLFDFNNPNDKPRSLPITGDNFNYKDFNPHGISLWQDSQTSMYYIYCLILSKCINYYFIHRSPHCMVRYLIYSS